MVALAHIRSLIGSMDVHVHTWPVHTVLVPQLAFCDALVTFVYDRVHLSFRWLTTMASLKDDPILKCYHIVMRRVEVGVGHLWSPQTIHPGITSMRPCRSGSSQIVCWTPALCLGVMCMWWILGSRWISSEGLIAYWECWVNASHILAVTSSHSLVHAIAYTENAGA